MKWSTCAIVAVTAGCNAGAEPVRLPTVPVAIDAGSEDASSGGEAGATDASVSPTAAPTTTSPSELVAAGAGWWCAKALSAKCEGICTREEQACTSSRVPDAGPCGADAYSPCKREASSWCVQWIEPMVWEHRTKCAPTKAACEVIRGNRDRTQRGFGAPPMRDITDCMETR